MDYSMISVSKALKIIENNTSSLNGAWIETIDSDKSILIKDILSPINMPPFNQSAMDGYAIFGNDINQFKLVGEIKAGDSGENITLNKGEAIRIFTGAIVPKEATAVIRQEDVLRDGNKIKLTSKTVKLNQNIRLTGEQIKIGSTALTAGSKMNHGAIGFLYTLGIGKVETFCKPKVIILATGDELTAPGKTLPPGHIYESNTFMLKAALKSLGINAVIQTVNDDYQATKKSIQVALKNCELLLTSGGISVGDYDFISKAMGELNVTTAFYKVKQKPGKPLFYGKLNETSVFGLPGNPAAALSCFYIYVIPAIRKMMGYKETHLDSREFILNSDYAKTKNLTHFLKGKFKGEHVTILNAQSSAMLSSYAETNCLIEMDEEKLEWKAGDKVKAYILP